MQTAGQQVALEARATRKVVVVNGNSDVLELLESALDGGRYDLLFADAGQHAYSLSLQERPRPFTHDPNNPSHEPSPSAIS